MRRGFTIIELLVASLLLGLLVTILTMIFNQSSIAWRTGLAGTVNMNRVRENISEIREQADNAFVWGDRLYRFTGLWRPDGTFRKRACSTQEEIGSDNKVEPKYLSDKMQEETGSLSALKPRNFKEVLVGIGNAQPAKTYTVNVMSGGPANDIEDYRAIWSFPDDFE